MVAKDFVSYTSFIKNDEKCIWHPSKKLMWLGIDDDLKSVFIPHFSIKFLLLKNRINTVLTNFPYSSARKTAEVCGKLIATKFILGDVVQLKTRYLHKVIESQTTWDYRVNLRHHKKAIKELTSWKDNLISLNKKALGNYSIPKTIIFTYARSAGIAAFLKNESQTFTFYKDPN